LGAGVNTEDQLENCEIGRGRRSACYDGMPALNADAAGGTSLPAGFSGKSAQM